MRHASISMLSIWQAVFFPVDGIKKRIKYEYMKIDGHMLK